VNGLVLAKSRERYTTKVTAIKDIWGALAITSNR